MSFIQTLTGICLVAFALAIIPMAGTASGVQTPVQFIGNDPNIARYGMVDTGADLLAKNMQETAGVVAADTGTRIVKWLQIGDKRISPSGKFNSECPVDVVMHPIINEDAFPALLRETRAMSAAQFVACMKEKGFLGVAETGNINVVLLSGPVKDNGRFGYLRMIAFARNPDGSVGQLLLDMPFEAETKTSLPIVPRIKPKAFTL